MRGAVALLVFVVPFVQMPVAKADTVTATLVRTFNTSAWSPSAPDPAGVVRIPGSDAMVIADSEVDETTGAGYHGVNVWIRTRTTDQHIRTFTTLAYTAEPTGLGFDPAGAGRLLITSDSGEKLFIVLPGGDGQFGTSDDTRTTILLAGYGITDPEDVAYNTANGHIYIADGTPVEVWDLNPVDGIFGNGNDTASHFDVAVHGGRDSEGLGYDPVRNTILVMDRTTKRIYEVTAAGALVRTINASGITTLQNPSDVEVAPASNGSGARNYWITDRTVDNGTNSSENDGLMFEVSIPGSGGGDTPPTVTFTTPAEGATVAGTTVALAATATDNLGVTRVDWFLDGGSTPIASDTSATGGWTGTWNSTSTGDGTHSITARATDTIGQTASDVNAVAVDNVDGLPSVTLTSPAEGATVTGSVPLDATASDDRGLTKVEWFLDGGTTPISTDFSSAGGWHGTWNSASTGDGPHTITARATDTGNQTASDANAVTVENVDESPSVTLTAPAEGATVGGTGVSLAATATDNVGVTKVEWFLDGTTLIGSDLSSAGGWTATWNSTVGGVTDGPHTITARATDTIGQTANDANGVTVDNLDELPSVTLTEPTEGAAVGGASVELAATATDDNGVAKVEWFVDGTTLIGSDTSAAGGWTDTWDTTTTTNGPHTITARVTDTGNQTATDANEVTVFNDGAPTITLDVPAEDATVAGAITLSATATDDVAVSQVQFMLDGSTSLGTDTDGSDGWTALWDSASTSDGEHAISAIATDTASNTGTDVNGFTVDNIDDAPDVSLTQPTDGALVSTATVLLSADASDDNGVTQVEFFLDGTTSLGIDTDGGDGWVGSWDTTASADGSYAITAVATDTSGQTTTSASRTVTLDRTGPTVSIVAPTEGSTVIGTTTVTAAAGDTNGVVSVQFFRDGTSIGTDVNGADGWSVSWNSASSPNGTRTLTARATDQAGNSTTSGEVNVVVANPTGATLDVPVATGNDDAEQKLNGNIVLNSSDLDLMNDAGNTLMSVIGIRFAGVNVPPGATITNAYVQFTADEATTVTSNLRVRAQLAPTPATFAAVKNSISSRPVTAAFVDWSVTGGWPTKAARTALQRTPDLKLVIQEIVGQAGWASGNPVVILVRENPTARLVASAFEDGAANRPVLHIEYTL